MTAATPRRPRVPAAIVSLVTIAGGAALAVIPAAVIAISARLFTEEQQGWISVAVLAATFAGQLLGAWIVEARLGSPGSDRRVAMPRWLTAAAVVAAVALAVVPPSALLLAVALPILVAALEVGRQVGIAERLELRELVASVLVGLGALGGVIAGIAGQTWALAPLAVGIAGAALVRGLRRPHEASRPDPAVQRWIVADVGVTGIVIPLINTAILGMLGAGDAVLFAAVSTASGVLAIPLNFMRARLLKEHSALDVVASAGAIGAAFVLLLVLHFTGLLGMFFGPAWSIEAATLPLLVACAWRAASLVTSLPFAALRRDGRARLVAAVRAGASVLTLGLGVAGLAIGGALGPGGGLVGAFLGLLVAELVAAAAYEVARRRTVGAAQLSAPLQ